MSWNVSIARYSEVRRRVLRMPGTAGIFCIMYTFRRFIFYNLIVSCISFTFLANLYPPVINDHFNTSKTFPIAHADLRTTKGGLVTSLVLK